MCLLTVFEMEDEKDDEPEQDQTRKCEYFNKS